MKILPVVLLLTLAVPATSIARSHDRDCGDWEVSDNGPSRFVSRHDPRSARFTMDTRYGDVTMLLTDDVIALQLSDRKLHEVRSELRAKEHDEDGDDNPLATAIKAVVFTGVRSLIGNSVECPLREIRDVRYDDGRLVLITRDDDRLFEGTRVDDESVLENFSEHDALAFVREFKRAKSHSR